MTLPRTGVDAATREATQSEEILFVKLCALRAFVVIFPAASPGARIKNAGGACPGVEEGKGE